MSARRFLLVLCAASAALLSAAPAASALTAAVRVEATTRTVCPTTTVAVPGSGTLSDSAGHTTTYTHTNALAALALAANARGFEYTWHATYGPGFVDTIAGLGAKPDWSDGWVYTVNGSGFPILDMGAVDFDLRKGDRVVFAQYPDGTFSHGTKLLQVQVTPGRGVTPGAPLSISVVGDDAAKANSAAEATRHGLDPQADPGIVETPSQFAPVPGATLHVGSRVYRLDPPAYQDATLVLDDLPRGTYGLWAEAPMDDAFTYVRSALVTVNVDDAVRLSNLRAAPSPYRTGRRLAVGFTQSKAATVSLTVLNSRGAVIGRTAARRFGGGRHTLAWSGRGSGPLTSRVTLRLRAVDDWQRVTTASIRVPVVR